jgi:hypothetical protein
MSPVQGLAPAVERGNDHASNLLDTEGAVGTGTGVKTGTERMDWRFNREE